MVSGHGDCNQHGVDKMSVQTDILSFVTKYVDENNRGCPKGVLIHVGGFKAKDIAESLDTNILESGRGSEGGLFPFGQKPSPKGDNAESLKARAFEYLRTIDSDIARELCAEYDAQNLARRKG